MTLVTWNAESTQVAALQRVCARASCDGKSQPGSQGPKSENEIEASVLTDRCNVHCEVRPFLQAARLPTTCAAKRRQARQAAAFLLQRLLVSLRVAWPRETRSMTKPLLLHRKRLRWVPKRPWLRHHAASAARSHSNHASSRSTGSSSAAQVQSKHSSWHCGPTGTSVVNGFGRLRANTL